MRATRQRRGRADARVEHVARMRTFEQKEIGASPQSSLEPKIKDAGRGARIEVEGAAMRRVGPQAAATGEPRIGPALGAVPLHDGAADPGHAAPNGGHGRSTATPAAP